MRFGSREICNVVFKAKAPMKIGTTEFKKGQPVLYIDTAKTSSTEQSSDAVYAQGGRGNPRLITWEGNKSITFTVEDALLSPIGFAILSGAGLFKSKTSSEVHVHTTVNALIDSNNKIRLSAALGQYEIDKTAPIFVMVTDDDGSLNGDMLDYCAVALNDGQNEDTTKEQTITVEDGHSGKTVFVDFYVVKNGSEIEEMQIDAGHFAGNFYVEAETLFRRQIDGVDIPAVLTFPNVKIQSNFTFSMSADGDPSTFTFTMDAMPGYTFFNKTRKVLVVMQIINEGVKDDLVESVMGHKDGSTEVKNKHDYYGDEWTGDSTVNETVHDLDKKIHTFSTTRPVTT